MLRLVITALAGGILSGVIGWFLIPILRAVKAGQSIREEGPIWHNYKAGTPMMGGLMFIIAAALCLVGNLFTNACKYNKPGGRVDVHVSKAYRAVVLTVADNGVGIPVEDLPRIFERFYRVDKARSRSTGGTGLGLSIVQSIVHTHGGDIEVDSEENVGTTFHVYLPLVDDPYADFMDEDEEAQNAYEE